MATVWPSPQRVDHVLLLVRIDPAEDAGVLDGGHRILAAGVDRGFGPWDPGAFGDCTDGGGVVPGDHLERNVLLEEVRDGLSSVIAQLLVDDHQGAQVSRAVQVGLDGLVGDGQQQYQAPVADHRPVSTVGSTTSGRTDHPSGRRYARRPLAADEKGTASCTDPACGNRFASQHRRVGVFFSRGQRPRMRPGSDPSSATTSCTLMPGAVRVPVLSTHDVHAGQGLNGRHVLHGALRWASRRTPTAIAMLVSSTRPSGTIVTTPAIAPRSHPAGSDPRATGCR